MIQDTAHIEKRYLRFIKTISESEIVYALKNKNGFATSSSIHFEDDKGFPIGLICFWAEKAFAKSCIKEDWATYKVIKIHLSDFMENWCIGMENDGLLIGVEFDQNMFGYEAEPLETILDITTTLKTLGKDLIFKKFTSVTDLDQQVKEILE
ncbi:hypothetical protein GCM10011344_36530 [Dokdonia pacifica]|uniref:DUF2750 domain-containing protein n=1 Tax=Dokdonia pacifica TaxID=1627892 RepID=A0A239AX66_9FLAO|nr:DUF2750 domain-containing protein [Dokdonia pacifica]GGG32302.1 hypothetical protein GCM10011344_36530 [Dokdonia pacifica]SNS00295.1 Protein of unknown function [Dokdonia pacifica]